MPESTDKFSLPYPLGDDPYDIPKDIERLAKSIDSSLATVSNSVGTIEVNTTAKVEQIQQELEVLEEYLFEAGVPNIEQLMVDIEAARTELEAAKEEFSVGQADLDVRLAYLNEEVLPELEDTLQEARDEMDTAMDEFMTRQTQFEDSISTAETEIAEAKQRLGQNEEDIATARQEAAEAQTTADQAVADALAAAGVADSKANFYAQISAPTGARRKEGNLWLRTTDNKLHYFDSASNTWVESTDQVATQAAADAAQAIADAADLQSEHDLLALSVDGEGGLKDRLETAENELENKAAASLLPELETRLTDAFGTGISTALDTAAADAQAKADAAKAHAENIIASLDFGDIGQIWAQAEEPPPGTTYEWTDEPYASPSIKKVDGVEVARNLMVYPSFEVGTQGWFVPSTTKELVSVARDEYFPWTASGSKVGRFTSSGTRDFFYVSTSASSGRPPATPGKWYAVTALLKTEVGEYGRLRVQCRADDNSTIQTFDHQEQDPPEAGQKYAVSFQAPDDTVELNVMIYSGASGQDVVAYTTNVMVAVADSEADAVAQVAEYFDGGTPDDRASDIWYDYEGIAHTWEKGRGWRVLEDPRISQALSDATAAIQAAAAAQAKAEEAHTNAGTAWTHADAAMSRAGAAETNAIEEAERLATAAREAAEQEADRLAKAEAQAAQSAAEANAAADALAKANAARDAAIDSASDDATAKANAAKTAAQTAAATDAKAKADAAQAEAIRQAALDATAKANAAKAAAENAAKAHADGLPKVLHGTGAPSGTAPNGSIWWQHQGTLSGPVIGQWNRVNGSWRSTPIDSEAIANLDVGKLTAGSAEIADAVISKVWADGIYARTAELARATIAAPNIYGNADFHDMAALSNRWQRAEGLWGYRGAFLENDAHTGVRSWTDSTDDGTILLGDAPSLSVSARFRAEVEASESVFLYVNVVELDENMSTLGTTRALDWESTGPGVETVTTTYEIQNANAVYARLAFGRNYGGEGVVTIGDVLVKVLLDGSLIVENSITAESIRATREMITKIMGAEWAYISERLVVDGDLIANNASIINAAMQSLSVTERADFVNAFADELYAKRFTAEVANISNLTVAARNLIPGMFNIANETPPPFDVSGFGVNTNDPSVWIQGRKTVSTSSEEDALIYLEAGVNYKFSVEARGSIPGTMYYVQLTDENGNSATGTVVELTETSYLLSREIAAPTPMWWPTESTFWVQKTGGYRLKIYGSHPNGADNLTGYQWFRRMRIESMNDGRLIVPGSIDTSRLNVNEIFGNTAVLNKLYSDLITARVLNAQEAIIGGALIKEKAITLDKLTALDEIMTGLLGARKIDAGDIAANAITAGNIAGGAITANKIAGSAITADKIASGAITASKIDSDAITAGKIAAGAIDGKTITGSTVRTSASGSRVEMRNDAVTAYNSSNQIQARYSGNGIELRPPGGNLTQIGAHIFGAELFTMPTRTRNQASSNSWSTYTTGSSLGTMYLPSRRVMISVSFEYIILNGGANVYKGFTIRPGFGDAQKSKNIYPNNQQYNTMYCYSYVDVINVPQGITRSIFIRLRARALHVQIDNFTMVVTPI